MFLLMSVPHRGQKTTSDVGPCLLSYWRQNLFIVPPGCLACVPLEIVLPVSPISHRSTGNRDMCYCTLHRFQGFELRSLCLSVNKHFMNVAISSALVSMFYRLLNEMRHCIAGSQASRISFLFRGLG